AKEGGRTTGEPLSPLPTLSPARGKGEDDRRSLNGKPPPHVGEGVGGRGPSVTPLAGTADRGTGGVPRRPRRTPRRRRGRWGAAPPHGRVPTRPRPCPPRRSAGSSRGRAGPARGEVWRRKRRFGPGPAPGERPAPSRPSRGGAWVGASRWLAIVPAAARSRPPRRRAR